MVVRESTASILWTAVSGVFLCGVLTGVAMWLLSATTAGIGLALTFGCLGGAACLGWAPVVLARRARGVGVTLVLGPDAVDFADRRRLIRYPDVGLVVTWQVHDSGDCPPYPRSLAVVPWSEVPTVRAAPLPHPTYFGGPFAQSGAPRVMEPYTVRYLPTFRPKWVEVVDELRRRCPRAEFVDLGVVSHRQRLGDPRGMVR